MANDNRNNQADEKENNSEDKNKENSKKKTKLFRVKFLKSYTPYVKGDIAGLNTEEAKELIKAKICEKV
jgi:hypothetical protein